jgi:hypothetical protein
MEEFTISKLVTEISETAAKPKKITREGKIPV